MAGRVLNQKQVEEIKVLLVQNKEKIEKTLKTMDTEHETLNTLDLNDDADFAAASRDYSTDIHIKQLQDMIELI